VGGKASTPVYTKKINWATAYPAGITQGAYQQIEASLPNNVKELEIFDSTGTSFTFAVGATGSEVAVFTIPPGGDTPYPARCVLGKGTQISVAPLDVALTNTTVGYMIINGYY
jgi:hypothetical protein